MKTQFRLPAFEEIRRLPAVTAELFRHAEAMAADAGDGYLAVTGQGRTRARAAVLTATTRAKRDNARNDTLVRVAGKGLR